MKKYRCFKCKRLLDESFFHKNKAHKNGLSTDCKECKKKWGKDFRKTELYRKNQIKYAEKRRHSPKTRFYSYLWRAKDRDIEFDLTFEEFKFFWGKRCYYCGIKIEGIGLDRIKNNVGYTVNNIVACCPQCNRMKMSLGKKEFIDRCIKIADVHS